MNGVRIGDYGHGIEFGVFITPAAESADEVVAWSELSEEAGYDLVTFNDHPCSAARLDASQPMPVEAQRMARGHTNGPRPVALPPGWLQAVDDLTPPVGGDELVSGG